VSIIERALKTTQNRAPKPQAPAQAVLPRMPELPSPAVADRPPLSIRAALATETFPELGRDIRFLKRPLLARLFGGQEEGARRRTLMVTSDLPAAGKSFISRNLAASFAQEKMLRVLLVDADPVRRSLSQLLGVEDRPGFMDLVAGEVMQLSEVMLATDVEALYFIPAGRVRSDATELIGSSRMAAVLAAMDDPNTVVVLDSPPLLLSSEGRVLADNAAQVLVVVEAGRSTAADVAQVVDLLRGTPATVSVVLNKVPVSALPYRHDMYYR